MARALNKFRRALRTLAALGPWAMLRFVAAWLLQRRVVRLRVPGVPQPLWLRPHDSDLWVLKQVFLERELDIPLPAPPRVIVDAGANVGYSAVYLSLAHPSARVIAIEPQEDNCRLLRMNTAVFPGVEIRQAALWHSAEPLELAPPRDGKSWNFTVRSAPQLEPVRRVAAVTVPDILRECGGEIDLLKIDIEGAETALFRHGAEQWIDHIRVLAIEIHGPTADAEVRRVMSARPFAATRQGERWIFRRLDAHTTHTQSLESSCSK